MSDLQEKAEKPVRDSKSPVYWIPFSVAAILLVIVGLFRFQDPSDNIYFIYICLIAFALATLPWISSFRVNGLFEIERAIEKTKDETRERIEQTDKRFEDRMFVMRAELMASLTSIQSQMTQQSSILNSTQSQLSQQSTIQASRQSNSQKSGAGAALGQVNRPEGVTVTQFLAGPMAGQPFLIVGDTKNNRVQGRPLAASLWQLVGAPNNLGTGVGQFQIPSKIR